MSTLSFQLFNCQHVGFEFDRDQNENKNKPAGYACSCSQHLPVTLLGDYSSHKLLIAIKLRQHVKCTLIYILNLIIA